MRDRERDFGGGVRDVHGDGSFVVDFDWLPGTCSFWGWIL
jgi:hypothetical protein